MTVVSEAIEERKKEKGLKTIEAVGAVEVYVTLLKPILLKKFTLSLETYI